jgi:hypothetical protein
MNNQEFRIVRLGRSFKGSFTASDLKYFLDEEIKDMSLWRILNANFDKKTVKGKVLYEKRTLENA